MLKLIKLEMKKVKMKGYLRGAAIANLVIMGITAILIFASIDEGEAEMLNCNFMFSVTDTLVKATFIVFASVLISKLIIEEYKNNTISLLFMYPINRKKLISAKLIITAVFTFCAIVLSNLFITSVLYISNSYFGFLQDNLPASILVKNIGTILINGLSSACIGLIPLFFGMIKKSVPATIVSSILIVSVVFSNNNGHSLNSIIAVPLTLALVGITVAYISIRNIEHVDVI